MLFCGIAVFWQLLPCNKGKTTINLCIDAAATTSPTCGDLSTLFLHVVTLDLPWLLLFYPAIRYNFCNPAGSFFVDMAGFSLAIVALSPG